MGTTVVSGAALILGMTSLQSKHLQPGLATVPLERADRSRGENGAVEGGRIEKEKKKKASRGKSKTLSF